MQIFNQRKQELTQLNNELIISKQILISDQITNLYQLTLKTNKKQFYCLQRPN